MSISVSKRWTRDSQIILFDSSFTGYSFIYAKQLMYGLCSCSIMLTNPVKITRYGMCKLLIGFCLVNTDFSLLNAWIKTVLIYLSGLYGGLKLAVITCTWHVIEVQCIVQLMSLPSVHSWMAHPAHWHSRAWVDNCIWHNSPSYVEDN